jgi:ubiquinone biosynthesis protein COQ4
MNLEFISKIKFFEQYFKLVKDPTRLDGVIAINKTMHKMVKKHQIEEILRCFQESSMGQSALINRPRLGKLDLIKLSQLPHNTFGYQFYLFLKNNNLNPNDIPTLDPENKESDFNYVRAHLYETHDIWHVITGYGTDLNGEYSLQAFYMTQFPAKIALVLFSSGFLNLAQQPMQQTRETMEAIIDGYSRGKKAYNLLGRDWSQEWQKDLNELRYEMGLSNIKTLSA